MVLEYLYFSLLIQPYRYQTLLTLIIFSIKLGILLLLLLLLNSTIQCTKQYTVFDQLKQRVLNMRQNKVNSSGSGSGSSPVVISAYSAFVLGAISKSIATIATYPAIR